MNFASDLDELQHYMGALTVDIQLGAQRRFVLAEARLCWLLIEKLEKKPKSVNRVVFDSVMLQMLNLQRALSDDAPRAPVKARPRPRLVK
jgi:hypothetical protein